ncbi:MAG: hypothetical protein C0436_00310 [Alphaproteobacteria bacterium]|nr:hypothetical protein [Alphaproteobacteria bacterium]
MNDTIETSIQSELPRLKKEKHILHFSCGADSIACYLRMREWDIEPTLVYMYYIEGLPLVQSYIDYFQERFGVRIHQLPNTLLWDDLGMGYFQPPTMEMHYPRYVRRMGWGKYDKKAYNAALSSIFQAHYHAKGLRVTDGINRAANLKRYGPVRHDKREWSPVAPFGFNDIKDVLRKHDCKLPYDYSIFGMSFESPRYWQMPILRDKCPETYKKILSYFPMMDLMVGQADAIGRSIPGGAKRRITMYRDYVMDMSGVSL